MKKNIERNWKLYLTISLVIMLIVLLLMIIFKDYLKIDSFIIDIIIKYFRSDNLTDIMLIITNLCSSFVLFGIVIFSLIFFKNKKVPLNLIINIACTFCISYLIKIIIKRPRPFDIALIEELSYSFPSSHSMISIVFYSLLIYYIRKYVKDKNQKFILSIFFVVIIILIGFSRIYLGVHYLSDVIGGYLIGIIYLIFLSVLNKKYNILN